MGILTDSFEFVNSNWICVQLHVDRRQNSIFCLTTEIIRYATFLDTERQSDYTRLRPTHFHISHSHAHTLCSSWFFFSLKFDFVFFSFCSFDINRWQFLVVWFNHSFFVSCVIFFILCVVCRVCRPKIWIANGKFGANYWVSRQEKATTNERKKKFDWHFVELWNWCTTKKSFNRFLSPWHLTLGKIHVEKFISFQINSISANREWHLHRSSLSISMQRTIECAGKNVLGTDDTVSDVFFLVRNDSSNSCWFMVCLR